METEGVGVLLRFKKGVVKVHNSCVERKCLHRGTK